MADDKGKSVADATAGAEDEDGEDEIRLRPRKAPVAPLVLKPAELLKSVGEALDALRAKRPLVSCLTNSLTALRVADGLLAAGASPIAALDSGEATVLATTCDALLVNVGTADRVQAEAMRAAVARANMSSHPWALDPAGVGSLSLRTYLAKELMRRFPAVIRGNASEILVLAGVVGAEAGGRGLESTAKGEDVVREASRLAQVTHATVIVSGEKDFVCAENAPAVAVRNGSPLMAKLAGSGCLQGALAAAFLGALGGKERLVAAVSAAVVLGLAGERAAAKAKAPGTFAAALLDALADLKGADVAKAGKLEILK